MSVSRQTIEDVYELSPMQKGMFFHSLYAPNSGAYIEQVSYLLEGDFNVSAFKQAWQQVIARHGVLRTSFFWDDLEKPLQLVHSHARLPLEEIDWRSLASIEQQEQLTAYLKSDRERGFVFSKAPLMRLTLIHLGERAYQFIWTRHHLLMDGWSVPLLQKEVFAFYEAYRKGEQIELKAPRPYGDYIGWLQQQDLSSAELYWREALKGFAKPTPLPFKVSRSSESTELEEFEDQRASLSQETTASLQALARRHQLTMNTLAQGAWALLLSRYSDEADVLFGAVVSGRPVDLMGVESMIGLFINTLPVRVRVDDGATVIDYLKRLQEQQVEQRDYEYSPLVEVQGWSELAAGQSLFESVMVFENLPVEQATASQSDAARPVLGVYRAQSIDQSTYPLSIIGAVGREFRVRVNYNKRRFDSEMIGRMLGHLKTILESMAANPEQRISTLELLTPEEKNRLLVEWNMTESAYPRASSIHDLFQQQAERTPDAIALIYRDDKTSYSELNRQANQLANHLMGMGVGPGVPVGICMERSPLLIAGLLGILKAGGAYVPIDPSYPKDRIAYMLEDSRASVLLTQRQLVAELPENTARMICLDEEWSRIACENDDNPSVKTARGNAAYVIYTSGSTGRPKGVLGLHTAAVNRFAWMWAAYPFETQDICCQKTSLSFVDSIWEIFGPLLGGVPTVIIPDEAVKDTTRLISMLAANQVTRIVLVPSLLRALLDSYDDLDSRLARLKFWVTSGEALPAELCDRFQVMMPGRRLLNLYGSSEVAADVTAYDATGKSRELSSVPIGRPIANTQVYLLGSNLQPVAIGSTGEIHIGGEGLAEGYINRPALTAEKFIPNPFSATPGARMYRTGDLGRYLPDGNVECIGRKDRQVKVRGFRIELDEVESRLAAHAAVRDAVIEAREDGEGGKHIAAFVVPQPGEEIAVDHLRKFLAEQLPDYMVPSTFVTLKELPLLPNGKINRNALVELEQSRLETGERLVEPRDMVEFRLLQLWEETLGVEGIGVKDNFFDLGGNSLLAVTLMANVRRRFGIEIPLPALFEDATIEHLAGILAQKSGALSWSPLVALRPGGYKTPLYFIHPSGGSVLCYLPLVRSMDADRPAYGLQSPGLYAEREPFMEIEQMAAHYIEAIRALQAEGPYYLAGWSMGGMLAYEMALQLQAAGQRVGLVALLDTQATVYHDGSPEPISDEKALLDLFEALMPGSDEAFSALSFDEKLEFILQQAKKNFSLPQSLGVEQVRAMVNIYKTNIFAMDKYARRPYPGPLTLFRTGNGPDPSKGWSDLAGQGVKVIPIPGSHRQILSEPNVETLARLLDDCLSETDMEASFMDREVVEELALAPS
jgi:surfactin family lipopeptide synthetase C